MHPTSPVPGLTWKGHYWSGGIVVPFWAGAQARLGSYASRRAENSAGLAHLVIHADETQSEPLSPSRVAAYRFVLENDQLIGDALVDALLADYRAILARFAARPAHRRPALQPIDSKEKLFANLGLSTVHILDCEKEDIAYVGFEFGCSWDEEHGAGAVLHRARVIDAGQADVAFSTHKARRDAGSR